MKGTTIFFDLETGGVEDHHPNIQVAAVAVREDWSEAGVLERKIDFEPAACDPEALRLNGYRPEDWVTAVTERQAMLEFDAFCRRHGDLSLVSKRTGNPYTMARLAGHNVAAFDIPRIRRAMDRAGVKFMRGCWWYPLDTYQRALWHFTERGLQQPEDFKLQSLAAHFGIEAQGAAHEALADVRLCARIARAIIAVHESDQAARRSLIP